MIFRNPVQGTLRTATMILGGTWNLTILPGGREKGVDLIRIVKNRENTWNLAQNCICPHAEFV